MEKGYITSLAESAGTSRGSEEKLGGGTSGRALLLAAEPVSAALLPIASNTGWICGTFGGPTPSAFWDGVTFWGAAGTSWAKPEAFGIETSSRLGVLGTGATNPLSWASSL